LASSEPPLVLELRTSRGFGAGLAVAVAAAIVAVLLADLPVSIAIALGMLGLFAGARAWQTQAALAGLRLRIGEDGSVDWRTRAGAEGQGRLASHARVGPLVALSVRGAAGRRRFAIWRDMLDADAWRRLNAALARRRGADSYRD
jgi:xanthosine utilization system XapX-like protein